MSRECSVCRRVVPSNAPGGLCPHCLLVQAELPLTPEKDSGFARAGGPIQGTTLSLTELKDAFPQLDLQELIGQGGMGAVYKARQKKLDRTVAVKVIRPDAGDDPAFAERFAREARTLARLNHPNIVSVHDFGDVPLSARETRTGSGSTLYYFLMEYVDGANLRQMMLSGRLSSAHALSIIAQICDALQYAHSEGIVHRDIKPENILFDSRGRVKIADFGLAKLAVRSDDNWTLTGTHQVMGTPRYMAPEQMEGSRSVDQRADIYSLGVIFYEMLTGTIPAGHFDPPSRVSGVHPGLDDVVLKAMSADPQRRYQSATELRVAVEKLSADPQTRQLTQVTGPAHTEASGFSTIVDREVAGAWRLVSGGDAATTSSSGVRPFLLLLLLFVIAASSTTLQWIKGVPNAINDVTEIRGAGLESGIGIACLMAAGALIWCVVPVSARRHPAVSGSLLAICLSALTLLALCWQEAQRSHTQLEHLPGAAIPALSLIAAAALAGAAFRQDLTSWLGAVAHEVPHPDFATVRFHGTSSPDLPDVCMVCGQHTTERTRRKIEYQPKWAEALMIVGFICGGIPGLVVAMLTQNQTIVSLPFCRTHSGHLSTLVRFASLGWLVPILLSGLCFLTILLPMSDSHHFVTIAVSSCVTVGVVSLLGYIGGLVWLALHRVKCEQTSSTEIHFSRVSPAFAQAVRSASQDSGRTQPRNS